MVVTAKSELAVGSRLNADRRGRTKVRVRCTSTVACSGVLKIMRGKVEVARKTYKIKARRSGSVTLTLSRSALRSKRLTVKLYNGSGRAARLADTSTVSLRRG